MKETTRKQKEKGAALVTVLMITILLGIACVALLSSVGANSKNSTDVLSETKAYYAAESGLQATINVLRNTTGITYSQAVANPSLSNWITYNCSGTKISVGPNSCTTSGTAYSISVTDPDNSKDRTIFSTVGTFDDNSTGTISYPNATSPAITLTFQNVSNCEISFVNSTNCNGTTNPLLSTLRIQKFADTTLLPSTGVNFSINYYILEPRTAKKTIRGTIKQSATNPNGITVTFGSQVFTLLATNLSLCESASATTCTTGNQSLANPVSPSTTDLPFYMKTTAVEPYRLKVLSTGYGPNGAQKQLEGIILKNFLNDYASPAAITMQGTGTGLVFNWTGGGNASITGSNGGASIGVMDSTGLATVNTTVNSLSNASNVSPAPAIITDTPDWLTDPRTFDEFLTDLKTAAEKSKRYFSPSTPNPTQIGNLNSSGEPDGTGITYYDGDFNPGNMNGGGILVVKGNLRTTGSWDFKGLLIITGTEGWSRNGGGTGIISGSVIIAPYTSTQLTTNTWSLPPKYSKTGGGTSDIDFDTYDLNSVFDGTQSITNFMIGVAEK